MTIPMATGPGPDELLACADAVRSEARRVLGLVLDLTAYDRDDVWQGRRADTFRAALQDHLRALTGAYSGAVPALDEAARRIEQRAILMGAAADRLAGHPSMAVPADPLSPPPP